jgi:hypothetical protein
MWPRGHTQPPCCHHKPAEKHRLAVGSGSILFAPWQNGHNASCDAIPLRARHAIPRSYRFYSARRAKRNSKIMQVAKYPINALSYLVPRPLRDAGAAAPPAAARSASLRPPRAPPPAWRRGAPREQRSPRSPRIGSAGASVPHRLPHNSWKNSIWNRRVGSDWRGACQRGYSLLLPEGTASCTGC